MVIPQPLVLRHSVSTALPCNRSSVSSSEQSPLRSVSASRRKLHAAPLLLLFPTRPAASRLGSRGNPGVRRTWLCAPSFPMVCRNNWFTLSAHSVRSPPSFVFLHRRLCQTVQRGRFADGIPVDKISILSAGCMILGN